MTHINTCARACVVHENKLLLVSNDGSYWYLPGGHMEPRENLAVCVKREVFEETGYEVELQDILYVFEFYDKRIDSHKIECVFRGVIDAHPETHAWFDLGHDKSVTLKQWFTLEEIQARNDVKPQFLKDGKWLVKENNKVYKGCYE
ncbi:MAG: NUDIX hydrolase [Alphaproteobacteria bacterium]|nr:NUDIX hydrolase [Alphaproteobacteria bacterium]